jgi:hypothetical protein
MPARPPFERRSTRVTVTLSFGSPAAKLDEVSAEAKKMLDSVEWRGS